MDGTLKYLPTPQPWIVQPRNNYMLGAGDSIFNHGQASNNSNSLQSLSVLGWAQIASDGRVLYGDISTSSGSVGVSGAKTADTRASHLPWVIADRPGVCVVNTVVNDAISTGPTPDLSITKANLVYIWQTLARNGILPVAWTCTPYQGADASPVGASDTRRARIIQINAWIKGYCRRNRIPCFDAYAVALDPTQPGDATYAGNWRAGDYDPADGLHPLVPGAKRLGVALGRFLNSVLPPVYPANNIASADVPDPANLLANPTMAGTAPVPTNWTDVSVAAFTGTLTAAATDGLTGNWWKILKTGTNGNVKVKSDPFTVVPGNRMALVAKVRLTLEGAGGTPDARIRLMDTTLAQNMCGFAGWAYDTNGIWSLYLEGVVPSGVTSARVEIQHGSTTGLGTIEVAQMAVYDLTVVGALHTGGSNTRNGRQIKAASYTMVTADSFIGVTSTASARTITLPAASATAAGDIYLIKDESGAAGTNNITVSRAGSDTIEGGTSKAISSNYGSLRLYSDGVSAWFVA